MEEKVWPDGLWWWWRQPRGVVARLAGLSPARVGRHQVSRLVLVAPSLHTGCGVEDAEWMGRRRVIAVVDYLHNMYLSCVRIVEESQPTIVIGPLHYT